jgi:hypothetical protein
MELTMFSPIAPFFLSRQINPKIAIRCYSDWGALWNIAFA